MLTMNMKSLREVTGYKIQAVDGEMGKVHDFYFDDSDWVIRYLVVDTGAWLPGRKVLVAPASFRRVDDENKTFEVNLTKEAVEKSPSIDADRPVSRQEEIRLSAYYAWPSYWGVTSIGAAVPDVQSAMEAREAPKGDPALRSAREVKGYHIHARDGEVGHVEDFLMNEADWSVPYLVVDTKNWLPGRKVVVSRMWADSIDWAKREMRVDLSKETIEKSPDFDLAKSFSRDYEEKLFGHYGKPRYW